MGISTDGILYFGIDIYNPEEDMAVVPAVRELSDHEDGFGEALDAWLQEHGEGEVGFGQHCSYDYPVYYLCTEHETAWRGQSVQVGETIARDTSEGAEAIKRILRKLGIPESRDAEIGWRLASLWG